jgi:hypothetical protein
MTRITRSATRLLVFPDSYQSFSDLFELLEDVADGIDEIRVEGEALAVDVNGYWRAVRWAWVIFLMLL